MTFQERTRLLLEFDELIRRRYKAGSDGYARKLGVSRGSFFRLLTSMREEYQAPIRYDKVGQCYTYLKKGRMHFGFVPEVMDAAEVPVISPIAAVVKQYQDHPGNRQDGSTP